jgi:hypothetical protein
MAKRARLVGVMAAAWVLLMTSAASAACIQGNLTGTWRLYITGADDVGMFWVRCQIVVLGGGGIKSGIVCRADDNEALTTTGGTLTLSSTCLITGAIAVEGEESLTATIVQGALDRGKTVASGVGRITGGDTFTFTMIKK